MKNKPKKRIYIYKDLYYKVLNWAITDYEINGTRAPNGHKIHDNFPFALEEYTKRKKDHGIKRLRCGDKNVVYECHDCGALGRTR